MIVVGLTGGIGSGKTTVAKEFLKLGVPIYIADEEAKNLMITSTSIQVKLKDLFGEDAYVDGNLNKTFIADKIFNNQDYLEKMNAIVHPEVASHFNNWIQMQNGPYVIKEVAILFETGVHKKCDFVITVTATKKNKIERLLKRDNTTVKKIEAIMKNQWTDEQRKELSNFIIDNSNLENLTYQVVKVHNQILDKIR